MVREKSLKNDCNFFFMNSGNIKCKTRSGHVSLYMMNCGWKHKSGLMENAFSVTEYKICSVILDVEIDGEFPHPPTSN